jgi:hypothetical protein
MSETDSQGGDIMPDDHHMRAHLGNLSRSLLRLHKALLDSERVSYERVHGRIETTGAFFQLVFAWLRPLSQLMVKIDELSEQDEIEDRTEMTMTIDSVRTMLTPSEEGDGFGRHYYDALQREPDVVLAHAAVRALLR